MLRSLTTDFIRVEVKCGECLKKIVSEWMNKKKIDVDSVTLFCSRTLAKYFAPSSPIRLHSRSSVVSVCRK